MMNGKNICGDPQTILDAAKNDGFLSMAVTPPSERLSKARECVANVIFFDTIAAFADAVQHQDARAFERSIKRFLDSPMLKENLILIQDFDFSISNILSD